MSVFFNVKVRQILLLKPQFYNQEGTLLWLKQISNWYSLLTCFVNESPTKQYAKIASVSAAQMDVVFSRTIDLTPFISISWIVFNALDLS